jgi:hypothetical protein
MMIQISNEESSHSAAKQKVSNFGGTLVVVPVSLLTQWQKEVASKAPHLKCYVYHGQGVHELHHDTTGSTHQNNDNSVSVPYLEAATSIAKYDVVLTTMSKLLELTRNNAHRVKNVLDHLHWHRMVVDECQFLKNDTAAIARAAAAIVCTHVWMLSGTPLTNKLDDLRGELSLLRVWPFTLGTSSDEEWRDHFWTESIKTQWDNKSGLALPIIHQLMKAVSMRHSRMQTRISDGSPLVDLPPKTEQFLAITMNPHSSDSYVNRWLECSAASLLTTMGRVDVQVMAQIVRLRQAVCCASIVTARQCQDLLHMIQKAKENNITKMRNAGVGTSNGLSSSFTGLTGSTIETLTLPEAIKEWRDRRDRSRATTGGMVESSACALQELVSLLSSGITQNNAADVGKMIDKCTYCQKARSEPGYLKCGHSLCMTCCRALLEGSSHGGGGGGFRCPLCPRALRVHIGPGDIMCVSLPSASESLTLTSSLSSSDFAATTTSNISRNNNNTTTTKNAIIDLDMDDGEVDRVLAEQQMMGTTANKQSDVALLKTASPAAVSSGPPYSVEFRTENENFQKDLSLKTVGITSIQSLRAFPDPKAQDQEVLMLAQEEEEEECAEFPSLPKSLVRHLRACRHASHVTPKIGALVDEIQKIRATSLEAKICIFSSFAGVLNEVEHVLDNVRYTLEYNMNTNQKLSAGMWVTHTLTGAEGYILNDASSEEQPSQLALQRDRTAFLYHVKMVNKGKDTSIASQSLSSSSSSYSVLSRRELEAKPLVVTNVASKHVRKNTHDAKLGVNVSNDRHAVDNLVESARPKVTDSSQLQVGFMVEILSASLHHLGDTGRIVNVHVHCSSSSSRGGAVVSYDIQPIGTGNSRAPLMTKVPIRQLVDLGSSRWLPCTIKAIDVMEHKHPEQKHTVTSSQQQQHDPYQHAVGYVRLDGSAGHAERRGDILEVFKQDPMASICLLTKQSAGVGLNLTHANFAIVMEPSMDAHDEMQSICRVHRIGQTRPVSILKLYTKGTVEERMLKRRQQRGELCVSVNEITGGDEDDNANDSSTISKGGTAEISSSKSITLDDLKMLLGV